MRLIDAEAVKYIDAIVLDGEENQFIMKDDLEKEPTINAVVIAHAYWKQKNCVVCICSKCGYMSLVEGHYCPHCGCLMDGDKNA